MTYWGIKKNLLLCQLHSFPQPRKKNLGCLSFLYWKLLDSIFISKLKFLRKDWPTSGQTPNSRSVKYSGLHFWKIVCWLWDLVERLVLKILFKLPVPWPSSKAVAIFHHFPRKQEKRSQGKGNGWRSHCLAYLHFSPQSLTLPVKAGHLNSCIVFVFLFLTYFPPLV